MEDRLEVVLRERYRKGSREMKGGVNEITTSEATGSPFRKIYFPVNERS